uniref:Peptidoglycan binding-like domain-containing protein n=1 Tax=Megaselia scalaris TaxID=36166 RepID=T1GMT2_MEGSC
MVFVVLTFASLGYQNSSLHGIAHLSLDCHMATLHAYSSFAYVYSATYLEIPQNQIHVICWNGGIRFVLHFFKFGNIPQTGVIDDATEELIRTPRCGVPDVIKRLSIKVSNRVKRFILQGSKWDHLDLTW